MNKETEDINDSQSTGETKTWILLFILGILSAMTSMIFNLNVFKNPIPMIIGAYFVFLYGYRNRYNIIRMLVVFCVITMFFISGIQTIPPWSNGIAYDMYDKGYTNLFSWNEYKSEQNSLINFKDKYFNIIRTKMLSSKLGIVCVDNDVFILYDFDTQSKIDKIDRMEIVNAVKAGLDGSVKIEDGKIMVWNENKFIEYEINYEKDFVFTKKT